MVEGIAVATRQLPRSFLACTVAQPVAAALAERPFKGHVQSVFNRSCNLINDHQDIITLALPEIGNGPFSVLVEGPAHLFSSFLPGQPSLGDQHHLRVGSWAISLTGSKIWDPQLPLGSGPPEISSTMADVLAPYRHWPATAQDILWTGRVAIRLRQASQRLIRAIRYSRDVAEPARQLAGLGAGLTPAGDDYLVGVMAALFLTQKVALAQAIARAAIPQTTLLSGAFLKAAAEGYFCEKWHHLAGALLQKDRAGVVKTCEAIRSWGATSGRDALAGFATILLLTPN